MGRGRSERGKLRNQIIRAPWTLLRRSDIILWRWQNLWKVRVGERVLSYFSRVRLFVTDHMDCSLPGFSVHEILQARILEWVAISSSRGSSWPKDLTYISCGFCIAGGFFTTEPPRKPLHTYAYSETYIHIFIYVSICICVCVHIWFCWNAWMARDI